MLHALKYIQCNSPEECNFVLKGSYSTYLGCIKTYDSEGNLLNEDPNLVKTSVECSTCKGTWTIKTQNGEAEIVNDSTGEVTRVE